MANETFAKTKWKKFDKKRTHFDETTKDNGNKGAFEMPLLLQQMLYKIQKQTVFACLTQQPLSEANEGWN